MTSVSTAVGGANGSADRRVPDEIAGWALGLRCTSMRRVHAAETSGGRPHQGRAVGETPALLPGRCPCCTAGLEEQQELGRVAIVFMD
jgi:hypothetical protein